MFTTENSENKLEELQRKIDELEIQNVALDREIALFLEENKVSGEQLSYFVSNPSNFSKENWETLQQEKKLLDEKLKRELENIISPLKRKKAQLERKVSPHWLFVR